MARISSLPNLGPPAGDEELPIVKGSKTYKTSVSDLTEAANIRAETAAAFAEEFSGRAYASQAAGEAATTEGQFFRVPIGTTPETYTRYQRTVGGSVEAAPLVNSVYAEETYSKKAQVDPVINNVPRTPGMFGAELGASDNIAAVKSFIEAQERELPTYARENPTPKVGLISEVANGKNNHAFPSAVRYSGKDYVFYREGVGHLEPTPIGNNARLKLAIRDIADPTVEARHVVYQANGVDPRDPNVLRDDYGNAILVGGKFKVVMFEWDGDYLAGNASAKVFDFDPASPASGLTNAVTLPAPIKAVKSDVRLLSNGTYAFVAYDLTNTCHFVTTTDWATFNVEEIGPGNEAAFCETADGDLNVITRNEENYQDKVTLFYKRALAGGAWRVHDILPYTLNAPTIVKSLSYAQAAAQGGTGSEGWFLFARDKTGRVALNGTETPISDLVCFWSKQSGGATIERFTVRQVIVGNLRSNIGSDGDSHYATAIASAGSGNFDIYTYSEFKTAFDVAATSFGTAIFHLTGSMDSNTGLAVRKAVSQNRLRNGSFQQDSAGYRLPGGVTLQTADGAPYVRFINASAGSMEFFFGGAPGETLFPKFRMRTASTNNADGRHLSLTIYRVETNGALTSIGNFLPELPPSQFGGAWRTVVMPPVISSTGRFYCTVNTAPGITAAVSDISHIEFSDDYTPNLAPNRLIDIVQRTATVNFSTTGGGAKSDGTISAAVWDTLGLRRKAFTIPFPARDVNDVTIQLQDATTQAGALRCVVTRAVVNSDGSLSASFAVAPGESGTMGNTASAKVIATIAPSSGNEWTK